MGSHPAAPSTLDTGETLTGVPFIVKVLAAETPLSIQAHPTLEDAKAGFAAEEDSGIPADALERTYRDPRHKPELALALTPFTALAGFDSPSAVAGRLTQVQRLIAEGDLAIAVEVLTLDILRDDYAAAVRTALEDPSGLLSVAAEELAMRDASVLDPALADTVRRISTCFPGDPSIFVALMLHRVDLAPGQAMYVAPGTPHAYLHGVAVEAQACSDNVLRGGLTSKHIDVDGLLGTIRTEPGASELVEPVTVGAGISRYVTEAEEFQLTEINFPAVGAQYTTDGVGPMIALCASGRLHAGGMSFGPGESAYLPGGSSETFSSDRAQLLIVQPRGSEPREFESPEVGP